MQQEIVSGDGEQRQEPDWVLASYRRRVGAWVLDYIPPILWISDFILVGPSPLDLAEEFAGTLGFADNMLIGIGYITVLGYIIWWLIAFTNGQTPGKQIVGIRVVKDNGDPSGWGYTLLREFVIKLLLLGFLSASTFGIAWLVDGLWPLWDRTEKMQALHDKMLGTIVVRKQRNAKP